MALRHSAAPLLWTCAACRRASPSSATSTSSSLLRFFSTSSSSSVSSDRGEGSIHFDDGSGEKLVEVLDGALAKKKKQPKGSSPDSSGAAAAVLTTRREALSLYRSIWRATALFTWSTTDPNSGTSPPPSSPTGEPWRDALRRSARQEFEASKFERDPVVIARMLVVGRDAVSQAVDKLAAKAAEVERGLRRSGEGGRGGGGDGGSSRR